MGNVQPQLVYIPKDFSNDDDIISLISSFRSVKSDDIMKVITKKLVSNDPLWTMRFKLRDILNEGYRNICGDQPQPPDSSHFRNLDHDNRLADILLEALKPCVISTILISPEIANSTISLESDPTIRVKVEDIFRILAYNIELTDATEEFEQHLAQAQKE